MGMEDDTRKFLILIVNTIAIVLLWMIIQVLAGIYFELGFFQTSPGWKNILYYIFFAGTLFLMIRYLKKKWKL
ncbi:MAG TPA: hypothetical protein VK498_03145 [Ferruginibacter sp.]|nr:hypothetical protein [Ferruginibacter sp.]